MTMQERIKKARADIDFKYNEALYWANRLGWGSAECTIWTARWVAAKDIYELLTGEKII